jgi:hypothetical protein
MYVLQNWTFAPGPEYQGTITVPGEYGIEQFAKITNVTRNQILFDPDIYETSASLAVVGGQTVLTLRQNTAFCEASEELQILMHDLYSGGGQGPASNVTVTNWPASQNVTGTVNVGNFPSSQNVNVQNWPSNQNVSGTVSVNNWPTIQPVSGTVSVSNWPVSQNVNGTVNVGNFPTNYEISNDVGNPIPITGNVNATCLPQNVLYLDSFGRERVSTGFTLADYKSTYSLDTEMISQTSGLGSSVSYVTNQACSRLTCGTSTNSYARRQSRMYHNYQPGKSQLIFQSFNFEGYSAGASKRIGYFDGLNGIYLEAGGDGTLYIVQRSNVSGSVQEVRYPQSSWNVDPMNGTGPSGYNLDVSKVQLMTIDFQWLGVGKIRVGFSINEAIQVAHVISHVNVTATAYWSQPSLPLRAEVVALATLSQPAYMDQICGTVISEGGYAEVGDDWSVSSATRTVGSSGSKLPLLAIRLKASYNGYPNRVYVRLDSVNVLAPAQNVLVQIIRVDSHTSITGGTWVSADDTSAVEYNLTATGYTPGAGGIDHTLDQFFIASGGVGAGNNVAAPITVNDPAASRRGYIAQNIDSSESMAFLVYVTSLGSNANAAGIIQWREVI